LGGLDSTKVWCQERVLGRDGFEAVFKQAHAFAQLGNLLVQLLSICEYESRATAALKGAYGEYGFTKNNGISKMF
jgi:hypothetical protein